MDRLTDQRPLGRGFRRLCVLLSMIGSAALVSTILSALANGFSLFYTSAIAASSLLSASNGAFAIARRRRTWMGAAQAFEILAIGLIAAIVSPANDYGGILLAGIAVPLLARHGIIRSRLGALVATGSVLAIDGIFSYLLFTPPLRVTIGTAAIGAGVCAVVYYAFFEEIDSLLSIVQNLNKTEQTRHRSLAELHQRLKRSQATLADNQAKTAESEARVRDLEEQIAELRISADPVDLRAFGLSRRETDVLHALVTTRGKNRDIGEMLGITEATVKDHLYKICNKVGLDTRLELVEQFRKNWPQDESSMTQ